MFLPPFLRNAKQAQLAGMLVIGLILCISLGGYFTWQYAQGFRDRLNHLHQDVLNHYQAQLKTQAEAAQADLEHTRAQAEARLRQHLRQQVAEGVTIADALHRQGKQWGGRRFAVGLLLLCVRYVFSTVVAIFSFMARMAG